MILARVGRGRRAIAHDAAPSGSDVGPHEFDRDAGPGPIVPALAVGTIGLLLYLILSMSYWWRFVVPSWDLGIFTQVARGYAGLGAPIVDIKGAGGYNILGDHFSPILVLVAPFYALFSTPVTLLVIQCVLFAFAVGLVTWEGVRALGTRVGVLIGLSMALSFGLVQAVAAQFHEIAFGVAIMAAALVCARRERWLAACLWAGALVWVKEDLGLTVFVFGLVVAWLGRGARRRWSRGLLLAAWGLLWFALATRVIIPFMGKGRWDYSEQLDVGALLSNPLGSLASVVDSPTKVITLLLIAGCAGVVGMRSPWFFLVVPTLTWRLLSSKDVYYGNDWHYDAILMPVVFLALIDAAARWQRSSGWRGVAAWAGPIISVVAVALAVPGSHLHDMTEGEFWRPNPRAVGAEAVLRAVPAGASVETDISLMAYLAPDHQVFFAGTAGNPVPQYVALESGTGQSAAQWAAQAHPDVRWVTVVEQDGYSLAKQQ